MDQLRAVQRLMSQFEAHEAEHPDVGVGVEAPLMRLRLLAGRVPEALRVLQEARAAVDAELDRLHGLLGDLQGLSAPQDALASVDTLIEEGLLGYLQAWTEAGERLHAGDPAPWDDLVAQAEDAAQRLAGANAALDEADPEPGSPARVAPPS